MTFGGPKDGRPNPATPGENSNFNSQISNWRDKLKHTDNKKRRNKLQNKIQGARVERWGDRVKNPPPPGYDSIYYGQLNTANDAYNNAINSNAATLSMGLRAYGLGEQYQDPNGAQYNPYSRASALQNAYQRDQRMTVNSYAAQGQLYSGAMQNAQDHDTKAYLSDKNDLLDEQARFWADIAQKNLTAGDELAKAQDAAELSQLDRIPEPTDAPPPPKFVKDYKNRLRDRLSSLKDRRGDAKNKAARKNIKQSIKKTKKKLHSIPDQYGENNV